MRKIEQRLKRAWNNNETIRISNSSIELNFNRFLTLKLFGNVIAVKDIKTNIEYFSLAGWNTITTKSRLRNVLDIRIISNKGNVLFHNYDVPFVKALNTSAFYDTVKCERVSDDYSTLLTKLYHADTGKTAEAIVTYIEECDEYFN